MPLTDVKPERVYPAGGGHSLVDLSLKGLDTYANFIG